ncbi:hypothetical protein [Nocardia otitidiscaviarum]|uniref:hypothetical protein n=1 Tax=Nocardia otitidiscaviarum TaxID=1823 RepID=UPI0012F87281|nr:hypothetical protein [Nocardia otitidiscaviarum]
MRHRSQPSADGFHASHEFDEVGVGVAGEVFVEQGGGRGRQFLHDREYLTCPARIHAAILSGKELRQKEKTNSRTHSSKSHLSFPRHLPFKVR